MFFNQNVAYFNEDFKSQKELFEFLGGKLYEKNLVKENYTIGIIEREAVFPTGLLVNGIGLAIPHTDLERVNESQVGFVSLKETIQFKEMGNDENIVNVKIVFMLALKQAHEQLEMLQKLVDLFQNEEMINKLIECTNINDYQKIIELNNLQ